jgi:GT2 family glycosyltransferase
MYPDEMSARAWGFGLVDARNTLMRQFLDNTDATHIWFIDTDMGFKPDTVIKLLEPNLPVIGALTYGIATVRPDDLSGYVTEPFIVAYDMVIDKDTDSAHYELKLDLDLTSQSAQKVAATGTGCLLISREAATSVREKYGDNWFDQLRYKNNTKVIAISEDMSFCYRLSTVGVPIYVHTGVKTNHMKKVWLS